MKLPRYPKYKDSSAKWLGQVPEHWDVVTVRAVARIINGYPFDSAFFDSSEGYPLIRIRDLNCVVPEAYYNGEFVASAAVDANDVLIGMDGDFNVGRWRGPGSALLNQRVCCARSRDKEVGALLEYALPIPLKIINELTYATTVKHLSNFQVEKIRIVLPPSGNERKQLVAFLDQETGKIDSLVAEQQGLIELLKEKRQAIISHAVTKGLSPDAPMKPSGVKWLGEVPAHWEVYRLTALYREIIEAGNDELPILSVSIHSGVSDRQLDEDEMERKVNRSEDTAKYKKVLPGDLVYNMMRAWQGGFGTVIVPGQISPAYVVARPKRDFHTRFIELLLRTPQAIEEIRCHSYGVTDFRLRLYWDNFKIIRVALPPKDEQEKILARIEKMNQKFDQLIEASNSSIATLHERRAALISAAVTGQIDVRNYHPEEAPAVCQ